MKITFTDTLNVPSEYNPKPASNYLPEWYKQTPSYLQEGKKPSGNGDTSATIKRCMPIFDAITGGYIIPTYVDIYVSQKDGVPYYEWPSFQPITWHSIDQAKLHPVQNGAPYPKWANPWAIKTPPGYSVLFTAPMHRDSVFTILPGIVDTDTYTAPVNFPFVLNDVKFEGLIPAGTPMAQVIPFKRESWKMEIGNDEDRNNQNKTTIRLRTKFFDSYKNQFRQPKEYK